MREAKRKRLAAIAQHDQLVVLDFSAYLGRHLDSRQTIRGHTVTVIYFTRAEAEAGLHIPATLRPDLPLVELRTEDQGDGTYHILFAYPCTFEVAEANFKTLLPLYDDRPTERIAQRSESWKPA